MSQFAQQTAWQNFFASLVAEAEADEEVLAEELKVLEAGFFLHIDSDRKVTQARAERDRDDDVLAKRKEYRETRARRKALAVKLEARERCAALLSRELTRRTGREPVQRRHDRYTA